MEREAVMVMLEEVLRCDRLDWLSTRLARTVELVIFDGWKMR